MTNCKTILSLLILFMIVGCSSSEKGDARPASDEEQASVSKEGQEQTAQTDALPTNDTNPSAQDKNLKSNTKTLTLETQKKSKIPSSNKNIVGSHKKLNSVKNPTNENQNQQETQHALTAASFEANKKTPQRSPAEDTKPIGAQLNTNIQTAPPTEPVQVATPKPQPKRPPDPAELDAPKTQSLLEKIKPSLMDPKVMGGLLVIVGLSVLLVIRRRRAAD